jgi:hypothetical protein
VVSWAAVAALVIGIASLAAAPVGHNALSAQPRRADKPLPNALPPKRQTAFHPRLPAYYNRVVSEKQRQAIYQIQREYHPRIEALKAQLAALTADRDHKIAAVLTPEQLRLVERYRAGAKARRAGQQAAQPKP